MYQFKAPILLLSLLFFTRIQAISPEICKILGFDPDPEHRVEQFFLRHIADAATRQAVPVLCMHGFENPPYSLENSRYISRDALAQAGLQLVSCNPQSSINFNAPLWKYAWSCDFGGEHDALVIGAYLLEFEARGCKKVHALGESRGAAAWSLVLERLIHPQSYAAWWQKLGVVVDGLDLERITRVKKMVQAGTVYLAYPWLDSDFPFKENIAGKLPFPKHFTSGAIKLILATCTRYSWSRPSAHKVLEEVVKSDEFSIVIDFAHNDHIVGNQYDALFDGLAQEHEQLKVQYTVQYHLDRTNLFAAALDLFQDQEHE